MAISLNKVLSDVWEKVRYGLREDLITIEENLNRTRGAVNNLTVVHNTYADSSAADITALETAVDALRLRTGIPVEGVAGRDGEMGPPGSTGATGADGQRGYAGEDGAAGESGLLMAVGPDVAFGTYTPTLTNVANLDASTAFECQWLRVGLVVTVSGRVDVDPTNTTTSTKLDLSLPFASNFTATTQAGGTAAAPAIAGQVAAIAAAAANLVRMEWIAIDTSNQPMFFSFTYRILA